MLFRCPQCSFQGNPIKWLVRTREVYHLETLSQAAKHPVYVCPYCKVELKAASIPRLGN